MLLPMETVEINGEQVAHVLSLAEDYYVEFKGRDKAPNGITKLAAAFANSSGGDIYVGIDELTRGIFSWNGFDRVEDSNSLVHTLTESFPPSDSFKYEFLTSPEESGIVLHLAIGKSRTIQKSSDGTVYRRVGAQIQAVRDEEGLALLRLQKGITSFEGETLGVHVELITDSYQITEFITENKMHSEAEPWLRNQLLIREDRPTVAGVVVFADEPQVVLPKASVMVYRYATTDPIGSREYLVDGRTHMIEGSAAEQIRKAVALTTQLIEAVRGADLNPVSYPPETLHEIITNAIIHRDYSIQDNAHVRIFDDRVEVESPGLLPGNVTPRNIFSGARFSRNDTIERMLHKFPDAPNKNVGEGLLTAKKAMEKMRLKPPMVIETESGVLVLIRHDPLDSPATVILANLQDGGTISNRQARALTGIQDADAMRRVLRKMIAQKAIEQVPGTQKGGYRYRAVSA